MFFRKNIPGRRESTYKEASQAAVSLVGQGVSEGSCEMSGWLVWRRRAEPDYVESCRQRREFGFDSKCIGKLVKGFKKKMQDWIHILKWSFCQQCGKLFVRNKENKQRGQLVVQWEMLVVWGVGRFHAYSRARESLQDLVQVYSWRIERRKEAA